MQRKTGIYKITNLIDGKIYIGSSSGQSIEQRWQIPYNRYLESAFKKYGKQNFKFEILELCKPKYCLAYEQVYLDYYKPWIETGKGYNICKIAGSRKGQKNSMETIEKQRKAKLSQTFETRQKISKSHLGKIHSLEHRKNNSKAQCGKIISEFTKKKMSEAQKIRWAKWRENK